MLKWKEDALKGMTGLVASSVKTFAGKLHAGETVVISKLIEKEKLDEVLASFDIYTSKKGIKKDALEGIEAKGGWICQYSQIQLIAGLKNDQRDLFLEILKDKPAKDLLIKAIKSLDKGYVYHA